MFKTLFAGVFALAAIALLPVSTQQASAGEFGAQNESVAHIDIGRIRSVLHLTPSQEAHWPRVEAALRGISREQAAGGGYISRLKQNVAGAVLNGRAVARLVAAARPLLNVLDDRQRQAAMGLAQEMGLGPMLAALN